MAAKSRYENRNLVVVACGGRIEKKNEQMELENEMKWKRVMKNARLTHTRTISKMKFKTNSFAPFSNSSSRSLVLFPRSRYNRIRNFTNSQYFDTIGKYMAKIRLHTVYLNRTDNICIPIEWNVCLCSLSVCKCESAIIFSCWCGFPYVWLACIRIKKTYNILNFGSFLDWNSNSNWNCIM